jgi:hypothetical protein
MKSPAELDMMVDEFAHVPPTRMARKLQLGAELHQEKKLLVKRLLDSVETIIEQPEHREFWRQLYESYRKIDLVLNVEDEERIRVMAAQAIFRGEIEDGHDQDSTK